MNETEKTTREEILAAYRELVAATLSGGAGARKAAQRFRKRFGLAKSNMDPILAGLRELAKAHGSLSTPELKAELLRRAEDSVRERLGLPVPKPSLFGTALFAGINITNHGTDERPMFRLEDVANLAKMPAEEIRKSLDARDEIELRRCELTGSEEVFVTEPGLYQALMQGESPIAEVFQCRVAGVLSKNPELTKKANELLAELAEDAKAPRA